MHSLYMCKVRLSMHTQHNQIKPCPILCSPTKGLHKSLKLSHLPIMLNLIDKKSGRWESMSVLGNHYIIVSSLGSWGGIITYCLSKLIFTLCFFPFSDECKTSLPHFTMASSKSTVGASNFLYTLIAQNWCVVTILFPLTRLPNLENQAWYASHLSSNWITLHGFSKFLESGFLSPK